MQVLFKISQQALWQLIGKAITAVCTFIILGVVARNYGESGTGTFTLALTYLAIFYMLADFGFNAHVLGRFPTFSLQLADEWRRLLGVRVMWSITLVILAIGLLPLWPFSTPPFSASILAGAFTIVASAVFVTSNLVFQSKLRYDLVVLSSTLGSIVGLVAIFWFSAHKYNLPFMVLAHFLGWLIIALTSLFLVRRLVTNILPIFDKRYTIMLIKDSWPIAATLALNVIYFRADAFILSAYKSSADVGIYNIAYQFFQNAVVLPAFIMNAYYPIMLQTLRHLKLAFFGFLFLALVATAITLMLAPFLIDLVTGGGFAGSATSLRILSLGFPAYFISSLFMWVFVAKKKYKLMLLVYAVGLIFNLIANLLFIPRYSFYAASWITVISEYLILAMQVVVLWRKREIDSFYRWCIQR